MILADADGLLMVYRILVAECPCLVRIPTTTNTILSLIHMAFTTNTRNLLLLVS
jgi:hypothetical protein